LLALWCSSKSGCSSKSRGLSISPDLGWRSRYRTA
jgi:hypothetical protein